jgi:hypothetical protein
LYNKDPTDLVYVGIYLHFRPMHSVISDLPVFRYKAALRGRDELWRCRAFVDILTKVTV